MKNLFYSILLFSNLSFAQETPQFECCNESNTHKPMCENFNRIQTWKILLDSITVYEGGIPVGVSSFDMPILNTAEAIKFKLDRKDSTFSITFLSGENTTVEGQLTMTYLTCMISEDCDGYERPESAIELLFGNRRLTFIDHSWFEEESSCPVPLEIWSNRFAIFLYGEVEILDK